MPLREGVLGGVVTIIGEVVQKKENVSPDWVKERLKHDDILAEIGKDVPELAARITHVGNVARASLKSETGFIRMMSDSITKLTGYEVANPEEASINGLLCTLPAVIAVLADLPDEMKYPKQALSMLENAKLTSPDYKYPVNLLSKLMILVDMLPKEE